MIDAAGAAANKPLTTWLRLRVFLPFALGYFLSLLFRVVNAVIAPDLIAALHLGPSDLGLLTAAYFIAFAAFQLPLGVLLDRFGPRRVEAALLLVAAAGAAVFSRAQTLTGLVIGRALIGLGVSACLMAAFKAFTLWFQARQWPRINGFQLSAGGLGAMAATAPVQALMRLTDFRGLFVLLAALTAGAAVLLFGAVPEKKTGPPGQNLTELFSGVAQVLQSRRFWRIAPLTMASQAAFMAVQSLWAGPWLRDVAGLGRSDLSIVLLWTAAAMALGYVAFGIATEWLSRHGIRPITVAGVGMSAFVGVQILIVAGPLQWTTVLWPAFGCLGTSGVTSYAALTQQFPAALAGRVNTSLNLIVFIAAFAAQWGIGAIIALWPALPGGGFAAPGYRAAFCLMIGLQVVGLVWYGMAGRRSALAKGNQ
jgi:predicted MFS family arabinose efflux permease